MGPRDQDAVSAERCSLLAKQPSYGAQATSAAEAGTFQEEDITVDDPVLKQIGDDPASLAVIMIVVLVGDLARGIFFPTLSRCDLACQEDGIINICAPSIIAFRVDSLIC
eukprot:16398-Heterococcus_DN1.PRE.2